jgi:lipid-binding SYLF domain-containing protein
MFKRNHFFVITSMFVLLVCSFGLRALSAKQTAADERERAQNAANALTDIMQVPEKGIPTDLMSRAHAIAVIPHMVKGAFIVGGQYGKGLVTSRLPNGRWSAPAFITIGGGSFGLQLGGEATDLVLVFTNREGFEGLLKGKVKLGADAGVAAGPVGRDAQASTDVLLKSPVLAYSRSKGVFAGISLQGAVVNIDEAANWRVYGKDMTAEDILVNGKARVNDIVAPFLHAVERYTTSAGKRTTE